MANIEAANWKGKNNWAVLLGTDGFITEGTGDNIFFVKNDTVYTPEPRDILVGIARSDIIEICDELAIPCVEKNMGTYDADECFMTASPFCILPVTYFNSYKLGNGKMGKVTKKLYDKWSEKVEVNIHHQIRDYSAEVDRLNKSQPTPYQFDPQDEE